MPLGSLADCADRDRTCGGRGHPHGGAAGLLAPCLLSPTSLRGLTSRQLGAIPRRLRLAWSGRRSLPGPKHQHRHALAAPPAHGLVPGPAARGDAAGIGSAARGAGQGLRGGLRAPLPPRALQRLAERSHGHPGGGYSRQPCLGAAVAQVQPRRVPIDRNCSAGLRVRGELLPRGALIAVGGLHPHYGCGTSGSTDSAGQ
mmetsp:Transcript_35741/g.94552  ORF Transcript_35741/g.94552 Transcript_35741/m.94552 type:complete len:200 (-) Transcript_35741:1221-1820(-)